MDEVNYTYDRKFEGNIFVVGRTGCGKTTFVQNLGKNKLFVDIKEVYWILKIELSAEREDSIKDCFKDQVVDFKYPSSVEDFNDLLEIYKRKKSACNENYLGKNTILDRVIVMNDVSGLADKSEEFTDFLTVSRKYGLMCVYIFHSLPDKTTLADDTVTDKNT